MMDAECSKCDHDAVTVDMVTGEPLCKDHANGVSMLS